MNSTKTFLRPEPFHQQRPRILLTGFTGILGKRFAYRLAAIGYEVVCPIRAGSESEAKSRFETVFHGMRDLIPRFDESLSGPDPRRSGRRPTEGARHCAFAPQGAVWFAHPRHLAPRGVS